MTSSRQVPGQRDRSSATTTTAQNRFSEQNDPTPTFDDRIKSLLTSEPQYHKIINREIQNLTIAFINTENDSDNKWKTLKDLENTLKAHKSYVSSSNASLDGRFEEMNTLDTSDKIARKALNDYAVEARETLKNKDDSKMTHEDLVRLLDLGDIISNNIDE